MAKTKKSAKTGGGAFAGTTHILFILDKSGSMGAQTQAAIDGYNEFLKEQKKLKDDTRLTLLLFDTDLTERYTSVPLADAEELTAKTYVPGGTTALWDAVVTGVKNIEKTVKDTDRALVVILTDGYENASETWTKDDVQEIIKAKEGQGNWTFTYMGASFNWREAAATMGIKIGNATHFDPNQVVASMNYTSQAMMNTRGMSAGQSSVLYSSVPDPRQQAGSPVSKPRQPGKKTDQKKGKTVPVAKR